MLWGAVVGATFVSLQVVTILVLGRLPQKGASEGELARFFESTVEDGTLFSVATFVTAAVCCPLVLAIIKLKKHSQVRDYLALHVVPARTALRWFGALASARSRGGVRVLCRRLARRDLTTGPPRRVPN